MFIYIYYALVMVLIITIVVKADKKNPLLFSAVTVFITCTLWMLPRYFYDRDDGLLLIKRIASSLAYSVYNAILIFGLGGQLEDITDMRKLMSDNDVVAWFSSMISFVAVLIYFIASMVTVSAIVLLFRDIFSNYKYKLKKVYNKKIFVFSELNDRSITLAEDICNSREKNNGSKMSKASKKKNKSINNNALIVFCDVFKQNSEVSYELLDRAAKINSICLKNDITSIKWITKREIDKKSKELNFFLIGENENENLNQTIELIRTYDSKTNSETGTDKNTTKIYLFSKSSTSEMSIQKLTDKTSTVDVIRVDYKRSMIYNYLYKNGEKLVNCVSKKKNKKFDIMIVGMGEHGFEMIKSLLWFCQRTGYQLEINAYDSKKDIKERFYAKCSGVELYKNSNTVINFHPGIDFNKSGFFRYYIEPKAVSKAMPDFIFVSIGDDSENIELARKIREFFARSIIEKLVSVEQNKENINDLKKAIMDRPMITTVVENSQVANTLDQNDYNIEIIGDFESVYSKDVIIESELEDIAKAVHHSGKPEENITTYDRAEFYKEYNYRSTIAQVIYYLSWKKSTDFESSSWENFTLDLQNEAPGGLGAIINAAKNGAAEEALDKKIEEYECCFADEKERWNYYVLTEGYEKYEGSCKTKNETDILKGSLHRHKLIVPFSTLSKEGKRGEVIYFTDAYKMLINIGVR